jgi:hypothetical protein
MTHHNQTRELTSWFLRYQPGNGSSVPQFEKQSWQHSQVVESLWDNPEFIKPGFHVGRFVTAAIDTKADRENIKVLYSSLKSISAQIDVSALEPAYYTFSAWI